MRRRLLWHVGFAALVLVTLVCLFEHLTTASLDGARQVVHEPQTVPPYHARPCVDPPELADPFALVRARVRASPSPPASPFGQARILGAAISYIQLRPRRLVSLALAAPRARLSTAPMRLVVDRLTSQLWRPPGYAPAQALGVQACHLPDVDLSTLRDFLAENRDVRPVGPIADLQVPVTIADVEEKGWNARAEILDRFPGSGGLTATSRPGIGRTGTEALVYVELVGLEGWFVVLRTYGGHWHVVRTSQLWIS